MGSNMWCECCPTVLHNSVLELYNFCGFVRENVFFFDQNICQFQFEKKIFIGFTLFRGGWGLDRNCEISYLDWELPKVKTSKIKKHQTFGNFHIFGTFLKSSLSKDIENIQIYQYLSYLMFDVYLLWTWGGIIPYTHFPKSDQRLWWRIKICIGSPKKMPFKSFFGHWEGCF